MSFVPNTRFQSTDLAAVCKLFILLEQILIFFSSSTILSLGCGKENYFHYLKFHSLRIIHCVENSFIELKKDTKYTIIYETFIVEIS